MFKPLLINLAWYVLIIYSDVKVKGKNQKLYNIILKGDKK